MIYLIIPLLFSIFGTIIIDCNLKTFISLWLPTYLLKRFTLDICEDRRRSSTWNKIYETILAPILSKEVLKELFGFGNTKFEVTSKVAPSSKMSKINKKLLVYHVGILILNIIGFGMCFFRAHSIGIIVYLLSLLWIISNIFYLIIAVIFDCRYKNVNYEDFIPNKIKKYKIFSVFNIFKIRKNK